MARKKKLRKTLYKFLCLLIVSLLFESPWSCIYMFDISHQWLHWLIYLCIVSTTKLQKIFLLYYLYLSIPISSLEKVFAGRRPLILIFYSSHSICKQPGIMEKLYMALFSFNICTRISGMRRRDRMQISS